MARALTVGIREGLTLFEKVIKSARRLLTKLKQLYLTKLANLAIAKGERKALDRQESKVFIYEDGYIPRPRASSYKPISYVIDNNHCWNCVSHAKPKNRGKYPVLSRGGKFYRMSRYIFEIENGYIDKDKFVMHICDNPECINPSHLKLGTPKENTADMIQKKRKPVGEKVSAAKLTEKQVIKIFNDKRSYNTIAKEYGVSKKAIINIRHGRSWKHLKLKEDAE
jgi:hypothetical protein